jgi:hypothetical protein
LKYNVYSFGGGGHNFIGQLIANMLTDGKHRIEINLTKGDAHPVYGRSSLPDLNINLKSYTDILKDLPDEDSQKILISITPDDIPKLELNHFYKNIQFNANRPNCNNHWLLYDSLVRKNILPKRDILLFKELPKEESEIFIKSIIERTLINHKVYSLNLKDIPNYLELPFNTIFSDMDTTISMIETFLNKKATTAVHESYEKYLLAQENLRINNFPWLPK